MVVTTALAVIAAVVPACTFLVDFVTKDAPFDDPTARDANAESAAAPDVAADVARPVSCTNGIKDGDETDVDCGGRCAPCGVGQGCGVDAGCATGTCLAGVCCKAVTDDRSTGQIAGTANVCCVTSDEVPVGKTMCGTGVNYSCSYATVDASPCVHAAEGAGNNGTACCIIHCVRYVCTAADAGPG